MEASWGPERSVSAPPRESLAEFLAKMGKKPFARAFSRIFRGLPLDDIEVAKALSSFITHGLIEMEKSGNRVYVDFSLGRSAGTLARFLGGEMGREEVERFIRETFRTR